jgi:hypothetical protein
LFEDLVRDAIREQSTDSATLVMQGSVPEQVHGFIPDLVAQLDQGVDPSVVADQALNKTFDIVETTVLTEATNHVLDKFSQRIVDLLFGEPFMHVLEKAAILLTNSTSPV